VYRICAPLRSCATQHKERKDSTGFPCSFSNHTYPSTIAYRYKQSKHLGKRDVAAPPAAATRIRTFNNIFPR
jgi:hypothetical protein